jgi:hypothetical protein
MDTGTIAEINNVKALRKAALIVGFAVLVMAVTVPVVEFYIFPKLIDYKDAAQTIQNLLNHQTLFSSAIFIHFVTVICDIIAAWALYIFLKPVNKDLALLAAWFRVVNTAFTIGALLNLVQVSAILRADTDLIAVSSIRIHNDVLHYLKAFNLQWRFMLVFFGIYMNLLGYLVMKTAYIPKFIGACIVIAGLGYVIENLKYFFYPNLNTGFLWFTYFGELIFMFWLLFKGSRIRELKTR